MADRSISYEFRANFTNFRAQVASASKATRDFGDNLTGLDRRGDKMRRGLDSLAGTAGRTGLVLGGAFAAAVASAANFDQAMSFVQAATHETADAMGDLRDAALEAGKRTAFSATEAAGAIEELAKAGVQTRDILKGGLDGALDLAAAGGLEVADAAEIAATAMTQFRLEGTKVPHVADLLAAAAGKAQGSVEDISYALKQSGLVAAQMGLSVEETTGTLAAFASAGLLGSDAGTSFRTMLLSLANPTEKSAKLMERLGITAYDANGQFVGMVDLAGQLQTAFEGKSQAERDSALATIFGSDAIRAAAVLYEQGSKGVEDWTKKVDDSGYAAETASIRMDNLKGDLEQLRGSLETALIGSGDGQGGFLRGLVQRVTDLVNAFNGLPGPVQSSIGAIIGLGALGAGGFWFTSKAINSIANTRQALADLGFQAGSTRTRLNAMNSIKFTAFLAALAAIGQGIEEAFDANINVSDLQRNLEALAHGRVSDDLKGIADDLNTLGSSINGTAEPLQELVHLGGILGDTPMDRAAKNIEAVDQALANMVESGQVAEARSIFVDLLEVIRQNGGSQVDAIKKFDAFGLALENVSSSGEDAAGATDDVGGAAKGAAPKVDEMSEALKKAREEAAGIVSSFLDLTAGVKDGKFSFGDWLKSLQESANALRDFRVNAAEAGKKGLDEGLIQSLQEMGEEGAVQLAYLAKASDSEIEEANRAWRRYERQVEKTTTSIAEDIAGVNDLTAMPKVDTRNLSAAERAANDLYEALIRLTGIGTVGKPKKSGKGGVTGGISGLYGDFASGGYTGMGGKYEPAGIVHRGEFVFSSEATRGNERRLAALHQSLRGFSDGGLVPPRQQDRPSWSGGYWASSGAGLSKSDLDRIVAALATVRPLVGTQYVAPHNYTEFRREQDTERRRASLGGFGG